MEFDGARGCGGQGRAAGVGTIGVACIFNCFISIFVPVGITVLDKR